MTLPLPEFYSPEKVHMIYRVDYEKRSREAFDYRTSHRLSPAASDSQKNWLLLVDVQNTFCIPDYELFVAGRSGTGAVEDNRRLCEFIYHNLNLITHISATLDTHTIMQVFHPVFFINSDQSHPAPFTDISLADLLAGKWKFNPALAQELGITPEYGKKMVLRYAEVLEEKGKFALTIWPYHAMLGGIGHALVSSVEEAIFFHSMARTSRPKFEIKGNLPFTENYSVIGPEVLTGPMGEILAERNQSFIENLKIVDKLIIAGQAKSHCVAWTISDLLDDIQRVDPYLASKVYLLDDCTSPVVIPGVVDHTDAADAAFSRFANAGMHLIHSTDELTGC